MCHFDLFLLMAFKARKEDLRRVEAGNELKDPKVPTMYLLKAELTVHFWGSHIHRLCLFISGVWNPVERRDFANKVVKWYVIPVSNCTLERTSNLYEKCLRLPAHSVIHARSVPVMPETKGGAHPWERDTLYGLREGSTQMPFSSQMNWSLPFKTWRAVRLGKRKEFFFDLTGL